MKNLVAFSLLLLVVGTSYAQRIKIEHKNDLSPYSKQLTAIFNTAGIFKDITSKGEYTFVTNEATGKNYVVGKGRTIDGSFVTFRSEAKIKSKSLKININESEMCTGDNCETCRFASTGGCDYDKSPGEKGGCNHTITTVD